MTDFKQWEEKTFVQSGLKCELPVQNNFRGGYYLRELATAKAVAGLGAYSSDSGHSFHAKPDT